MGSVLSLAWRKEDFFTSEARQDAQVTAHATKRCCLIVSEAEGRIGRLRWCLTRVPGGPSLCFGRRTEGGHARPAVTRGPQKPVWAG